MASLLPNFRTKQQPTQIFELNAGYYFQLADLQVQMWSEIYRLDRGQSLSLFIRKPGGERESRIGPLAF